jgi:hypothetical protein
MRYPRHLMALDAFGVIAMASATSFVLCPQSLRPSDRIDSLWANLATEMIGIWVGVRLIDWIIRRNESATKARVRTVRNMRFVERKLKEFLEVRRAFKVMEFEREIAWFKSMLSTRSRYLKADERRDVDSFYLKAEELYRALCSGESKTDPGYLKFQDLDGLYDLHADCVALRRIADDNIMDETTEDDGL